MQLTEYIRKYFIYILVGLTILFALVTLAYMQLHPTPTPAPEPIPVFSPSPTTLPINTTLPSTSMTYPKPGVKYDISDPEKIRRDSLVGQLLGKLPYSGTNFSLKFDYSKGQFIASIKVGQETEGNKELDAF